MSRYIERGTRLHTREPRNDGALRRMSRTNGERDARNCEPNLRRRCYTRRAGQLSRGGFSYRVSLIRDLSSGKLHSVLQLNFSSTPHTYEETRPNIVISLGLFPFRKTVRYSVRARTCNTYT